MIVVPVSDAITVTVTVSVSVELAVGLVIATVGDAAEELCGNRPVPAAMNSNQKPVARPDFQR